MAQLPQNGVWAQVSGKDVFDPQKFGGLIASTGLDLCDNYGRLRLGRRMILNTDTNDLSELSGIPVNFWLCGTKIYTICGNGIIGVALSNNGTLTGIFSKSTGGTPPSKINSATDDGVFANNKLYITELDSGTVYFCNKVGDIDWASRISVVADSVGTPHMVFSGNGRVYMTLNYSRIVSMNSAESVATSGANTIILNGITGDFTNVITRPFFAGETCWLPCVNTMGGPGYVYEWDGSATTYQRKHKLQSPGAVSGCDYNDIPYIMDVYGELLAWNGSTFKRQASLFRKNKKLLYNALSLNNDRFMHPNGMTVVDHKIRMVIDNRNYDATSSIEETITAGVYEFDPEHPELGIYHIGPLTSTKSGETIKDYGAIRIAGAGGIAEINLPSVSPTRNGSFLVGAKYYIDATNSRNGIFYDDLNDTLQKAGSFVTLKFPATSVKDIWNYAHLLHSKLQTLTDKIVGKYRVVEVDPVEATITYVSTTQFTVLNSAIDLTTYFTAGKGAEVEVTQGVGANKCSHITATVLAGGTWTVTVDQTYTGATVGATAKARFQKWIWVGEQTYEKDENNLKLNLTDVSSAWIQYKFWAMWTGKREIERFITDENQAEPIKLSE